jgi:DNA-binding response OmpR family regulator
MKHILKHIVIVEDDRDLGNLLMGGLREQGHEVRLIPDGRQLKRLCECLLPDLVITDIFMEHKDGLEVIRDLRREFPPVKILAISGHPSATTMLSVAKRMGADGVVQKPFFLEEALNAARGLLECSSYP